MKPNSCGGWEGGLPASTKLALKKHADNAMLATMQRLQGQQRTSLLGEQQAPPASPGHTYQPIVVPQQHNYGTHTLCTGKAAC